MSTTTHYDTDIVDVKRYLRDHEVYRLELHHQLRPTDVHYVEADSHGNAIEIVNTDELTEVRVRRARWSTDALELLDLELS